jgi:hypothetical protein
MLLCPGGNSSDHPAFGGVLHLRRPPVRTDAQRCAYYDIDGMEGQWNRGREEGPNLGYKLRYKEAYFPVPPQTR